MDGEGKVFTLELYVANWVQAEAVMRDQEGNPGITHIVSIGRSGQPVPPSLAAHPARKLRLEFHDISCAERDGMNGPSREDILKLVAFFGDLLASGPEPKVLIHCFAGQSRSVAAGLILLAMQHGDWQTAREELAKAIPDPTPNKRMLELAEGILRGE